MAGRRRAGGKWQSLVARPRNDVLSVGFESNRFWVHLMGIRPWEAWEHGDEDAMNAKIEATEEKRELAKRKGLPLPEIEIGPCPACGAAQLSRRRHCCVCDRSGQDNIELPGIPVGAMIDKDWHAEPTVYTPDPARRGGIG